MEHGTALVPSGGEFGLNPPVGALVPTRALLPTPLPAIFAGYLPSYYSHDGNVNATVTAMPARQRISLL